MIQYDSLYYNLMRFNHKKLIQFEELNLFVISLDIVKGYWAVGNVKENVAPDSGPSLLT